MKLCTFLRGWKDGIKPYSPTSLFKLLFVDFLKYILIIKFNVTQKLNTLGIQLLKERPKPFQRSSHMVTTPSIVTYRHFWIYIYIYILRN